jgi:hypothetical protein
MFLEAKRISDIQRLLDGKPEEIERIRGTEISLSVALFLAVTHRALWLQGSVHISSRIARLGLPCVSRAINCLTDTQPYHCAEPFGAPPFDVYRISSKADLLSEQWSLFCDRFRRSANGGRNGDMYVGVAGVLWEMADNVVWHAFEAEDKPCPALAGFHVTDDSASFCVADYGQGFLRSLHRAEHWAQLKTDHDALDAVVNKHATSRPGEKEGGGFKQLFNSLLDFNGLVILRSGSCAFRLENTPASTRRGTASNSIHVPGSAITTVISTQGQPEEQPLEKSS